MEPGGLATLISEVLDARDRARWPSLMNAPADPALTPADRLDRALTALAQAHGDPLFGLHLAQRLPRGGFGLVEYVARASRTLGGALTCLTHFSHLLALDARVSLCVHQSQAQWRHAVHGRPAALGFHGNALLVASLLRLGEELAPQARAVRVFIADAPRELFEPMQAELPGQPQVEAGPSNGFDLAAEALALPLRTADETLHRLLREEAARLSQQRDRGQARRVERMLDASMDGRGLTLQRIAERLETTPRRLQRQLRAEGVRFEQLVDEARRRYALARVPTGAPLQLLSWELSYLHPSTLVRAFTRWTGKTPTAWRASPQPAPARPHDAPSTGETRAETTPAPGSPAAR